MKRPETDREAMLRCQIVARGIQDPAVLDAIGRVPRERFVLSGYEDLAYQDSALPIQSGQTISQPFIVARMTEALWPEPADRVLEIGTGSGYAAAVLAEIVAQVFTIERHARLAGNARTLLAALGYRNVHVRCGDGSLGWPEEAPFDGIVVTAGGPCVPPSLKEQLAIGGRLVIPVGRDPSLQQLLQLRRVTADQYDEQILEAVRFVPLIGAEAWHDEID